MKVVTIIAILFSCFYIYIFIDRTNEVEMLVYTLYVEGFEDLYFIDENYNLLIDKQKVKNYFKNKGYKVTFIEDGNAHFYIQYKSVLSYKKEYYFYVEKRYGN